MVAPIHVGKAASAATEGVGKLGGTRGGVRAKGGSGGEHFERLLEDPGKTTQGAAAHQAGAAATHGVSGASTSVNEGAPLHVQASHATGPGDKILSGIDKFRQQADHLVQRVSRLSEAGASHGGQVSQLISAQATLAGFTVTSEVGSKATGKVSQGIQTLLKGGG